MRQQKVIITISEDSTLNIEFDPPAASDSRFEAMDDAEKILQHQAGKVFEVVAREFAGK